MSTVVHIVEIRLRETDEWSLCDIFAHDIGDASAAPKIAEVTNLLRESIKSHEEDAMSGTKTTGGDGLVKTETFVNHRGGSSFFRHTIRAAHEPGPWLNAKGAPIYVATSAA